MYVHKLTLENVRQFPENSLEFQPGFNLLVGENGAGKTTILRSLSAVLGITRQSRRRPRLTDEDISFRRDSLRVSAEIVDLGSNRVFRPTYQKRLWKTARRSADGLEPLVLVYPSNESTCSSLVGQRIKRYSSSESRDLRSREEDLYEAEMGERPDAHSELRFGRSRPVRAFVRRILSKFSEDFLDFGWRFEPYDCSIRPPTEDSEPPEFFGSIRDTVRRAIMRRLEERRKPYPWPDRRVVVMDWDGFIVGDEMKRPPLFELRDVLKEVKVNSRQSRYLQSCTVELRLTPRIVIRTRSSPLYLSQLSDGQQRLFSLFVDIARELSLRDAPHRIHEASAIVLIDEIDVHLHPKWQRMIVPGLQDLFPYCQFIATTHSPFVIQAVDRNNITRLGDGARIPPNEDAQSIEDIIEDIQDIKMPQRSVRAERLSEAAERYFKLLKLGRNAPAGELHEAEIKYREASEPFTSQPALHALVKIELLERR